MPPEALHLGIDGGGSGCRCRLVDGSGATLGTGTGPACNLSTGGPRAAAAAVLEAAVEAFRAAGLDPRLMAQAHVGIGIAGAGADAGNAWAMDLAAAMPFRTTTVRNDAEVACLGAHGGADGAILILGTGSHGVMIRDGQTRGVGGWGFLLSDSGSGAVLGQRAARRALLAHEALATASPFTVGIMARFHGDPREMLDWALKAIPRDWAGLAPLVFTHARLEDAVARGLLSEAVAEVEALLDRLVALGATRIALLGGLARDYRPLLLRHACRLVEAAGDAVDGALHLAQAASPADVGERG